MSTRKVIYKDKEVWQNNDNIPEDDFLYAIIVDEKAQEQRNASSVRQID